MRNDSTNAEKSTVSAGCDTAQAQRFLELLGVQRGDRVHYRALKQGKSGQKQRYRFPTISPKLKALNDNGYSIYCVINPGGDTDADIAAGRALFFEHDDLPKADQLELWRAVGLPEPTMQVDTGGKSIHSYWALTPPFLPVDEWRQLQSALLEMVDADRAIKNPSRVMRLPGFVHPKTGEVARIITASGLRYPVAELRKIIAPAPPPAPKPAPARPAAPTGAISLEEFLSKANREALRDGAPEGQRNQAAFRLGCDLLGCAEWLRAQGVNFEGDPEVLYRLFCDRCAPPLSEPEVLKAWKSLTSEARQPARKEDSLRKSLDYWRRQTGSAPTAATQAEATGTAQAEATGADQDDTDQDQDDPPPPPTQAASPKPDRAAPPAPFDEDDAEFLREEVTGLVQADRADLHLPDLLPERLANAFCQRAASFNAPVAALALPFLAVASGCLKAGTVLEIAEDYRFPALLWVGLIAESGSAKSPLLKTVFEPLRELDNEAQAAYAEALQNYERERRRWERNHAEDSDEDPPAPPIATDYFFTDATPEAIASSLAQNPEAGGLVFYDELAGFIRSFNAYRSGDKGSDRQHWLSLYDGTGIKINRKSSGRQTVPKTSLSVLGSIQPSTLKHLVAGKKGELLEEVDGFWPRFCWLRLPQRRMPAPGNGPRIEMGEMLKGLYRKLAALPPATYKFETQGLRTWAAWHEAIEDHRLAEAHPALSAVYPKLKDRVARIALTMHCVASVLEEKPFSTIIPTRVLESAIAIGYWEIEQVKLVYAEMGVVEDPDSPKVKRLMDKFGTTPFKLKDLLRAFGCRLKKADALPFVEKLVAAGILEVQGDLSQPRARNVFLQFISRNPDDLMTKAPQTRSQRATQKSSCPMTKDDQRMTKAPQTRSQRRSA